MRAPTPAAASMSPKPVDPDPRISSAKNGRSTWWEDPNTDVKNERPIVARKMGWATMYPKPPSFRRAPDPAARFRSQIDAREEDRRGRSHGAHEERLARTTTAMSIPRRLAR